MSTLSHPTKHSSLNNFDLLRLFAAAQVALTHGAFYLGVDSWLISQLHYFPGVPIFFFISGYLIYTSYANLDKHRLAIFFTNRFLRLYPALWVCFLVTLCIIYFSGYMATQNQSLSQTLIWVACQITFFQFYNPPFLREFGVGAVNGSLWSVSVEIQFYVLTPLLFFWMNKHKHAKLLIAAFCVVAALVITNTSLEADLPRKLIGVSFLPLFYMFVFGAILSTKKNWQAAILSLPVWVYLLAYLGTCAILDAYTTGLGSRINLLTFASLCPLIYKLAFTKPELSFRLLKGNDISYGVYIYHMPIVNLLIHMNMKGSASAFAMGMTTTFLMAIISWVFIEKPSLKLKKHALRGYR